MYITVCVRNLTVASRVMTKLSNVVILSDVFRIPVQMNRFWCDNFKRCKGGSI